MGEFTSLTRREFMQAGAAGAIAAMLPGRLLWGDSAATATKVWVFHGTDKARLIDACMKTIDAEGGLGLGSDVKKLSLKVNAAWARPPKMAADTNPQLVDAFLKGCRTRGIKELVIPENPCDRAEDSFTQSGLLAVAKANNIRMLDLRGDKKAYVTKQIPGGKNLTSADVARDVLETDCLVNMPVVKHHGGARMTSAMKNWMGSVRDRRTWHRNNLHQCIADFSTFIKPQWNILDATNIMMDRGPKGPSRNMKRPDLVILSRAPVAADSYASALIYPKGPAAIPYLQIAGRMKLGQTDIDKMSVKKIEVE